jgi:hypothetical protein
MITGIGIGIPFKVKRGNALSGWDTLTDGTTTFRREIRDGYLYLDKTLTVTGFAGLEDTDLTTVKSINVYDDTFWATRYPSDLVLTVDSDTQITLDWVNNGVKDWDVIQVERADTDPTTLPAPGGDPNNWFQGIADITDLDIDTYADNNGGLGLTPETPYWYRIRYNYLSTFSAFTDIETETTDPT